MAVKAKREGRSTAGGDASPGLLGPVADTLPIRLALLDESATILEVNLPWNEFAASTRSPWLGVALGDNYLEGCDFAGSVGVQPAGDMAAAVRRVLAGKRHEASIEYSAPVEMTEHWFEARVLRLPGLDPPRFLVSHRDVTDSKVAAAGWAEYEARFNALIEHSLDTAVLMRADGKFISAGPGIYAVLGYRPEELVGRNVLEMIHPDDVSVCIHLFQEMIENPESKPRMLFRCRARNGAWRWVETDSYNALNVPGVEAVVNNYRDVTSIKRTEESLQATEARHRALIQGLDAIIWEADANTFEFTFVSAGVRPLLGYSVELWSSTEFWWSRLHSEDRERAVAKYMQAFQTEGDHSLEYRAVHEDGHVVWLRDRFHVPPPTAPAPRLIRGVLVDITARRRREEQVLALLDVARDISGTLDLGEIVHRVERRSAQVLSCDRMVTLHLEEGTNLFRTISSWGIPPELQREVDAVAFDSSPELKAALSTGRPMVINDPGKQAWLPPGMLEFFGIHSLLAAPLMVGGKMLGVLTASRSTPGMPFDDSDADLFSAIARQLAVAMDAVEVYRRQQEEARVSGSLARLGSELISALDRPDLPELVCKVTAEITGCDFSHILTWRPAEDGYGLLAGFGHPPEYWEVNKLVTVPKSVMGAMIPALQRGEIVCADLTKPRPEPQSAMSAAQGMTVVMHTGIWRGSEIVGVLVAGLRNRKERFTAEQKRILGGAGPLASLALEQARLLRELEHANRLKAEFVATMSHELRTPLHIIIGYHDLLSEKMFGELTADQIDILKRIERSAQGLLEMVDATLDVGRLDSGRTRLEVEDVDLSQFIEELKGELPVLRNKSDVNVEWTVDPGLSSVRTDRLKFKIVLKNVIGNAVKFTGEGRVTVHFEKKNKGVEVRVTDTGIGISSEMRGMIFEPFRQGDNSITREFGGIGLGLYIVRRLLEILEGHIDFESEVGVGSTFRVWIPLALVPRRAGRTSLAVPPEPGPQPLH